MSPLCSHSRSLSVPVSSRLFLKFIFSTVVFFSSFWSPGKPIESHSVVSDSLRPHKLYSLWNSSGLEWVAFPFSGGSSQLRDQTQVSHIVDGFFFFFNYLFIYFSFIFISWRLMTLRYCSGFCHTTTWISHGFTCIPHPDPPSHLPLHPIPLGLPSAPGPSTCLMHPTWAGDLFHPR